MKQFSPIKKLFLACCVCGVMAALFACDKPGLTIEMPTTNLQEFSTRDKFDPVAYLESLKIFRGALRLDEEEKRAIALFVFDAYHYPFDRSIEYAVSFDCDLVRIINVNFMTTDQGLHSTNGLIQIRELVAAMKAYLPPDPL